MKKLKKISLLRSVTVLLLIVSTSLFLFTGCQSKDGTGQTAKAKSNNKGNMVRPNADEMKKRMQDNIASLVTDGTINQSQADKILEALTANTQRFNGGTQSNNNQQNNQQNPQQNNQQNSPNNTQGNNRNMQKNNALSKLVSDGVITQAQADAVMQKIRGNFTRPNGN